MMELREKFRAMEFERLRRIRGKYVTSATSEDTSNDARIFKETQVKRILRSWSSPFVSQAVKNRLKYFSQNEDQDEEKLIYQKDAARNCEELNEQYAIQNIGHATVLIQIQGFNILTDPVFGDLNQLLYPGKTKSHPEIAHLPKIDVILISHNHRDHVDEESLKRLKKYHKEKEWPKPTVFVPMGDKQLFESIGFDQIVEVEWFTKISMATEMHGIKQTINFISIPADHRSGRYGFDHHRSLVTGWIINPELENVIFKLSGDTTSLTDRNQQAVDAVLWNEIEQKTRNENKIDRDIEIPDIICLEPSGPNYTRRDMNATHQSTSYSALLKFIEAKNLANFSGKAIEEFLEKIKTVMMHHNKFELGPDRFNECLFVFKKLLNYMNFTEAELNTERDKQIKKLEQNFDWKELIASTPFTSRLMLTNLPDQTSLLVRSKYFIIDDMKKIDDQVKSAINQQQIQKYLILNTIFPKIGQRMNNDAFRNSTFDVARVNKYPRRQ